MTHTVVWGGGEKPADVIGAAKLPQGHGGRIDVEPDLTVADYPQVYVLGDAANIAGADGKPFPSWDPSLNNRERRAARNILDEIAGKPRKPFHYKDKGIMAMIGRNAAVAEMGAHRHEVDGPVAFAAWLGVHAMLLSGVRTRSTRSLRGLGLLQQEPRDGDGECTRCRSHRLGR